MFYFLILGIISVENSEVSEKEKQEAWDLFLKWRDEPSFEYSHLPRFYFKVI